MNALALWNNRVLLAVRTAVAIQRSESGEQTDVAVGAVDQANVDEVRVQIDDGNRHTPVQIGQDGRGGVRRLVQKSSRIYEA